VALHRAGGKITKSHTTIIDAAVSLVERAEKLPEVTKISLGEIKIIGKGKANVKFLPIPAGLKAVVRGNISKQEIFIYSSDPEKTKNDLLLT
jgi:hypothetical protein